MPKTPRPAPFLACYLPDGTRLETAIARACAEGDAAIRAGADVHEAASAVEARISGLVRHVFAWGRNGAKLPAADPDAHAAAGEAAEAARLDGLEAERAEAEAERDGTPLRGPIAATAASLREKLRDVDGGITGTRGAVTAAVFRSALREAVDALEAVERLPGFLPVADPSPEHRALLDARNLARIGLHRAAAAAGR